MSAGSGVVSLLEELLHKALLSSVNDWTSRNHQPVIMSVLAIASLNIHQNTVYRVIFDMCFFTALLHFQTIGELG